MPYESRWVKPEILLRHKGVTVYHVYKDDEIQSGVRFFHYTTNLDGSESDETTFDVRDIPGFDVKLLPQPEFFNGVAAFLTEKINEKIITRDGVAKPKSDCLGCPIL